MDSAALADDHRKLCLIIDAIGYSCRIRYGLAIRQQGLGRLREHDRGAGQCGGHRRRRAILAALHEFSGVLAVIETHAKNIAAGPDRNTRSYLAKALAAPDSSQAVVRSYPGH